jgi:hypothetical protein
MSSSGQGSGDTAQTEVRSPSSFADSIKGCLVGAVLASVLLFGGAWIFSGSWIGNLLRGPRNGTIFNVDQPTVVRQIQKLQRLETVSYTMDKIISGAHENAYLPKFLAGDRLLLVVHGEVVAGINLASLQSSDVVVNGDKVSIHLPAAELFSTRLDNARTKVYSRDTGLFTSPDPNLEGEVREEAERQLQQAALQDGILKTAHENARGTMAAMLQGFGFREVQVQ